MSDESAEDGARSPKRGASGRPNESRVGTSREDRRKSLRHELRTPLNQILGYAEMLQEEAEELGREDFIRDLQRIQQAGRTLLVLINRATDLGEGPETRRDPEPLPPTQRTPTASRGTTTGRRAVGQAAPPRILVVDDDAMNRDVLARRLVQRGYSVETADGGTSAIALLSDQTFDLVLLDVMMPTVSGTEVLRVVRETSDRADLPVIMATARDASEDIVEALELGANDYVTKPLDFAVVMARVETQLALKNARDEIRQLNDRLEAAQQKIGELVDSAGGAMDDVGKWASSASKQIAEAIGVESVGFWLREQEIISGHTHDDKKAPSDVELRQLKNTGRPVGRQDETLVPVLGHTGELFGVVVVTTRGEALPEASERLVSNFARHLGGALELARARRDLARAAERQQVNRQELLERGVDLLAVCRKCGRCFDHTRTVCSEDGTELSPQHVTPYRIVGRYRLERVVGEGGMGTVYRAHDERLEREVAIKLIRSEHFNNENVRMRFENEARTVAKIDHPSVIAVYDSGELEDRSLFIVMEWLEGQDLGMVLKGRGPGHPREVACMLRETGQALEAAHAARLVHRDIKPENIFVSRGPSGLRFKLLDFGVAKELTRNARLTETGSVIGTPLYMSPEQLTGRPIDARSDLYSLASVAFQALTGRRTVRAQEFGQVLLEVVNESAPRLSDALDSVPGDVDRAFCRAFEKDVNKRPRSVTEWLAGFIDALEKMESSKPGWGTDFDPLSIQHNPTPDLPRPDVQAPTLGALPDTKGSTRS